MIDMIISVNAQIIWHIMEEKRTLAKWKKETKKSVIKKKPIPNIISHSEIYIVIYLYIKIYKYINITIKFDKLIKTPEDRVNMQLSILFLYTANTKLENI